MRLIRATAPECPHCGCNATQLVGAGERFGRPWAKFGCVFCRREFGIGTVPADPEVVNGVIFRPVRCPKCDSKNCIVTRTAGQMRLHACRNCGQRFKSIEAP